MRLFGGGQKMADAAEVIVFLERYLVVVRNCHRHAGRGHKFQIRKPIPGVIDDWIENEVEATHVGTDDGADLGGVSMRIPMCRVETEFEVDAIEKIAFGGVRRDEKCPQLEPVIEDAVVPGERI